MDGWMDGWMAATLYLSIYLSIYSLISVGENFRVEIISMGDNGFLVMMELGVLRTMAECGEAVDFHQSHCKKPRV
jgi:hypothetical protein